MYDTRAINSERKHVVFSSDNLNSFANGNLVIVKKSKDISKNDQALFYNFYTNKFKVLEGKVVDKVKTNDREITYELENGRFVSSDYVIAKSKTAVSIPLLGFVFAVLTTSPGYLTFALLPTAALFIYQLNNFIKINKGEKDVKKN